MEKRCNFELFKSNVCHRLKESGDIDFLIETLEKDMIREYYNRKWYLECFYLLAMVDLSLIHIQMCIKRQHLGEGSPKQKFRANMDAIHMLKKLETEERNATWQEQEILSKYVGWGGIPEAFDEKRAQWANEYQELKETLTEEEYIAARASTLNEMCIRDSNTGNGD